MRKKADFRNLRSAAWGHYVLQPWASLIACGAKKTLLTYQTTNYRGWLLIYAGLPEEQTKLAETACMEPDIVQVLHQHGCCTSEYSTGSELASLPVSGLICAVQLLDSIAFKNAPLELLREHNRYLECKPGNNLWKLGEAISFPTVPFRARPGQFRVPYAIVKKAQVAASGADSKTHLRAPGQVYPNPPVLVVPRKRVLAKQGISRLDTLRKLQALHAGG